MYIWPFTTFSVFKLATFMFLAYNFILMYCIHTVTIHETAVFIPFDTDALTNPPTAIQFIWTKYANEIAFARAEIR